MTKKKTLEKTLFEYKIKVYRVKNVSMCMDANVIIMKSKIFQSIFRNKIFIQISFYAFHVVKYQKLFLFFRVHFTWFYYR